MNLRINKKNSIIYLFKKGRKQRLINTENTPSEFFYGYKELKKEGYNVNILEQLDLRTEVNNIFLKKFLNLLSRVIFNLPLNMIFGFLLNKSYKKLDEFDFIVATTNSLGIVTSLAKNLGLISSNILFFNMGLFSKKPNLLKLSIYRYLFKKVKLLTISKTEYEILNSFFVNQNIRYVPFGVDENFWFPQEKKICKPYVLAVGNDLARDWETLVRSWDENLPILKIVTSLPVNSSKNNIEVIKGNWHSQLLTDIEMRELYCNSEFVILPLKETFQPSGQSTCLQAMACSKAVLISKISGIWDRKLLKHRENIFFIKPCDSSNLNKAANLLCTNMELRKTIEKNGRKLIKDHFNISNMKNNLKEILEEN